MDEIWTYSTNGANLKGVFIITLPCLFPLPLSRSPPLPLQYCCSQSQFILNLFTLHIPLFCILVSWSPLARVLFYVGSGYFPKYAMACRAGAVLRGFVGCPTSPVSVWIPFAGQTNWECKKQGWWLTKRTARETIGKCGITASNPTKWSNFSVGNFLKLWNKEVLITFQYAFSLHNRIP